MAKKKKTWLEIKATKPPEEWRRINNIYGKRHQLRNRLRVRAAELLDKIHNYRLVQSPGPADTLIDEVHKVLRLPYCWSQEDLDHAEARLNDIEINLRKIKKRITLKSSQLANALMMVLLQSKETDSEKGKALVSGIEYIANQMSMEKIESFENNRTNYIMTLLRTKDGYYPTWMVKSYYNGALQLFSEDDIKQLAQMFAKLVLSFRDRDSIANMMEVEKEDEKEIK